MGVSLTATIERSVQAMRPQGSLPASMPGSAGGK